MKQILQGSPRSVASPLFQYGPSPDHVLSTSRVTTVISPDHYCTAAPPPASPIGCWYQNHFYQVLPQDRQAVARKYGSPPPPSTSTSTSSSPTTSPLPA